MTTDEWDTFELEENDPDAGVLDATAVDTIRRGTSGIPDVEAAERLLDQVAATMVSVSTGGPRIAEVEKEYARDYRALAAVLRRLGIPNPNRYADLWRWHGRWSDGTLPSWASRRAFIGEMYAPTRAALDAHAELHAAVATAIDDAPTGWADVDHKLGKLRRRMREARDADDLNAVGLLCISVLAALGRSVFDPAQHLTPNEPEPHPDDAKRRIGFFLQRFPGDRHAHVRRLVRAAYDEAQAIKHRDHPSIAEAGVAADSAILLAAIIRRLADQAERDLEYELLTEAAAIDEDDLPPI